MSVFVFRCYVFLLVALSCCEEADAAVVEELALPVETVAVVVGGGCGSGFLGAADEEGAVV